MFDKTITQLLPFTQGKSLLNYIMNFHPAKQSNLDNEHFCSTQYWFAIKIDNITVINTVINTAIDIVIKNVINIVLIKYSMSTQTVP